MFFSFILMDNFFFSDCGAKDSEGKRPLHFAAHGKGSHAKDVVDVLIEEAGSHIGNLIQHYTLILLCQSECPISYYTVHVKYKPFSQLLTT